ncbi:MAG: DEAD/DEAH box helicase [bacterium]|nr:DEAD/DEAH box helicase [bacterium]
MVVLQGNWWDSRLHVWGVAMPGLDLDTREIAGPGLSTAPVDEVRALIGEWSPDALLASVADEDAIALLPGSMEGDGSSSMQSVAIPTLAFSPADTIDLLAAVAAPLPRVCGDSLRYWARLAEYVLALLANRRFVPDIEECPDETFAALWRPFAQEGDELAWVERIAAVMPPVCAAVDVDDDSERPNLNGSSAGGLRIVEEFIGTTVDAVIRRNVAQDPFFDRIHERAACEDRSEVRWLSALLGGDRLICQDREESIQLTDRIRAWVGRLDDGASAGPLRLCFSLTEPTRRRSADGERPAHPDEEKEWGIALHLEALDNPAQRWDVAQVWAEHGGRPTLLGRHLGHRRDQLLTELDRAALVFPLLEDVSAGTAPSTLALSISEAHTFLREWAPLLHARGFGVVVPEWATQPERQLGLHLSVRPPNLESGSYSPAPGKLGLDSVISFDWRVAIGDAQLSLPEFEQLAAGGAPLVPYGDSWLEMDAAAAEEALTFMRGQPQTTMSLRTALRMVFGVDELDAGLPITGISGTSWLEQLLKAAPEASVEALPQPEAFRGTLRPYQRRGLDWLAFLDGLGIGACLADDMGLGKTIQLIALLLHERKSGEAVGPTLLFAPASVVGNWEREIERFTGSTGQDGGLRVLVHHGPNRLIGDTLVEAAPKHDVVITTYALGHRDLKNLRRVDWRRIALDEAQKIKNPQAAQTKAIRLLPAANRVALTGTPLENHLSELWSIMDVLNPGLLGSATEFRRRFVVPIEKLADRTRQDQLRRMLGPFVLRRAKTDPGILCDLPEKMEMRVFCNLTPEQAALYQRTVDETMGVIDSAVGIRRRGLILALLTKLKQVCNHPCHLLKQPGPLDERSGKCERLVEMLEEVFAEGDAALVFTQYRKMGDLLERLITERLHAEVLFLHGGTPPKRRDKMVERFQDPDGGIRVFLLSLKAGGLGLNLTAANHVFHFDRWWNPAVEAQATDRAHRMGQTRCVQVHKFVCIGTVEERIDKMLEEKRALTDSILHRGDEWLTDLSTTDLREYIALAGDAVG